MQSLPSRERGLKYNGNFVVSDDVMSLPSRERGLKFLPPEYLLHLLRVAPFAGAWIEIELFANMCGAQVVAPFAGAWIEIEFFVYKKRFSDSRSLRGSVD